MATGRRTPRQGLQSLFYWEGLDGSRVLSHIAGGYAMASGLISSLDVAADRLPGFLASHDNAGYPYDAVLVNGAFSDNQGVAAWLPEVVEKWNAQWEYPKLILGRPEDFFRYIEQNFAAKVPVLRTDFGAWWEDGAVSSAQETALCRRAEERAVTAEMLHSLAAVLRGEPYPKWDFDELWRNILLYNEHTWGAAGSISNPESEQTVKQWEVKGSFARQADAASRELLAGGMVKLAGLVPRADLVVFNPLAWPRTRSSHHRTGGRRAGREDEAANPLPGPARRRQLLCRQRPALGRVSLVSQVCLRPAQMPTPMFSEGQMENEFYRVTSIPRAAPLRPFSTRRLAANWSTRKANTPRRAHLCQRRRGQLCGPFGSEGLPAPKFTYHRQTECG